MKNARLQSPGIFFAKPIWRQAAAVAASQVAAVVAP
jgi:hypothetical protein